MVRGGMTRGGGRGFAALLIDLAAAGPAVLWLVLAAAITGAGLAGYGALAAPRDVTLSEAVALRVPAEVVKLIRAGADPAAPARVRGGIIREHPSMLTPLEAAVVTRRPELVRLLVQEGAVLDDTNYLVLSCLAADSGFDDVLAVLGELGSRAHPPDCEGVRRPVL